MKKIIKKTKAEKSQEVVRKNEEQKISQKEQAKLKKHLLKLESYTIGRFWRSKTNQMKKLLIILTMPFVMNSQIYVPAKVERLMYDSADATKRPIDTVVFENNMYVFNVKHRGISTSWEPISKTKLYSDPWKGLAVTHFAVDMSLFAILPNYLHKDKMEHFGAGGVIGLGANVIAHKITKKKLPSFLIAVGVATGAGVAKEELWDRYHHGVVSAKDVLWTSIGGVWGALASTLVFGHKELAKKYQDPFN